MKYFKLELTELNKINSMMIERLDFINLSSKVGTIYHDFNLNKYVSDFFQLDTRIILSFNDNGELTGYYLITIDDSKFVKNIFSPKQDTLLTYGGPISINDDPEELTALLKACEEISQFYSIYIKSPPLSDQLCRYYNTYNIASVPTLFLDLFRGEETLWGDLDNRIKRNFKKAQSHQISIEIDNGNRVEEFSNIYKDLCQRTGLPFHGSQYYKGLADALSGKIIFFYALLNNEIISVMSVLKHRDIINPWFGGTHTNFLKTEAGTLVYWEIIKYGCKEGFHYFDFLGLDKEKIAFYKRGFGGFEVPVLHLTKKNLASKIISKGLKWVS